MSIVAIIARNSRGFAGTGLASVALAGALATMLVAPVAAAQSAEPAGPAGAGRIDLLQAVQLGLSHESVLIARKGVEAGRLRQRLARAPLLPQVSAAASATRRENVARFFGRNEDGNSESLNLTQTLWNARQRSDYATAKKNLQLAQLENDRAVIANIIAVTEAYFDVLSASSRLRLARGNVEAVEAHKKVVDTLFEIHESTILESTETVADLDLARVAVIAAENDLANARQLLVLYIGGGDGNQAALQPGSQSAPQLVPVAPDLERLQRDAGQPLADWLREAGRDNHDLRIARVRLDIAANNIRQAEQEFYPSVALRASMSRSRSNLIPGDFSREAVVSMEMPVYHGGQQQAQLKEAHVAYELRQLQITRETKQVTQRVTDLYRNRLSLHKRIFALQSLVLSNRKKLDATRDGFARGDRTSSEVLEAQNLLVQSEIDLISAIHDYILSGLQLKQSAGTLALADIESVNRLYFSAR